MAPRKDTIFERFLAPIFRLMIDGEELQRVRETTDWEQESLRFLRPDVVYPDYYRQENFHGVEGGYLNPGAAVSYDPITQYVLPPGETVVRQGLINTLKGRPRRILDLGCGTGSTTLMLKQTFPDATVVGLDLSPYMLVMADLKAKKAGLEMEWRHGNAEATGFSDNAFDVVTASLLFHETPPQVTRKILRESFRLLKAGGQVLILDGCQKTLRQVEWLTEIFEEPYIKSYAGDSVEASLGAAGFEAVQTEELWWIHQVSQGFKPIPGATPAPQQQRENDLDLDAEGWPAPA